MSAQKKIDSSGQLRESLLDLARANSKEREARKEAESLLEGLDALTNYDNREKMFDNLLDIFRNQIGFENAFILSANHETFRIVASTSPQFNEVSWPFINGTRRITLSRPSAFFDIKLIPEWQKQTETFRTGVCSALHILLRDYPEPAFLICTHPERGFFTEKHLRLATRFARLASQALINLDYRLELEEINARLVIEIEERQLAQSQVANNSKMAAVGEMAGGIAHEINTPLGAIMLNAEMIELKSALNPDPKGEILRRAKTIIDIGRRISKIIDGLKGFSRDNKTMDYKRFTANELIESTMVLCREKFKNRGVSLIIEKNHLDTLLSGQIIQLSQTLLNLLNNSFDAVQSIEQKWIKIQVVKTEQHTEISVTDCGPGISRDIAEKIFQPFFTTKDIGEGTGIGLSISANIVKNHGGRLFYDETCANTHFIIQLPIVQ